MAPPGSKGLPARRNLTGRASPKQNTTIRSPNAGWSQCHGMWSSGLYLWQMWKGLSLGETEEENED